MRKEIRLTSSQGVQSVNVDFPVVAISIENPTASPIYVRLGAPDTPTVLDADRTIPAAESRVIAASGQVFCFALANPTALVQSATSVGGLFTVANVILLSEGEIIPSFGSASFLSLSTAQLSNGAQAFAPSPPANVYDLGPWGGAIFYFYPTGGQTNIVINVSNDAITWYPLGNYALWPNVPSTITVPKIMRYVNMEIFATGIAGEPSPAGTFYVRGSLSEINDLVYTPTNTPIVKAVNITGIGAFQFQFMTAGLPAVSMAYIATAGSTVGAQVLLLVEASSDLVNWRQVTYRTQSMSQGITLYRALGNLDRFIRVSVQQNIAGQNEVGSLYASIPPEADLGYILNTIQQSLGDTGAPTNTNQDIYHELDSIRIYDSNLPNIKADTANLAGIKTDTGNIYSVENSYLPAINTGIGNVGATLSAYQPNLLKLTTIDARALQGGNTPSILMALTGGGVVNWSGVIFTSGDFIQRIVWSTFFNIAAVGQNTFLIAIGNGAVISRYIFQTVLVNPNAVTPSGSSGVIDFTGLRSGGIKIGAAETQLAAISGVTAGTVGLSCSTS